LAAPPIVPVTITARMTSTWRSVIMGELPGGARSQALNTFGRHLQVFSLGTGYPV
jgi:hypothetical protein